MMFTDKSGSLLKDMACMLLCHTMKVRTWPVNVLLTDGTYRFLNVGAWTQFFEIG